MKLPALLLALPFASCASIMTPSLAEVEVVSAVPVAFEVDGEPSSGTTPASVWLTTGQAATFTWTHPDGTPGTYLSEPDRMHGWMAGNLLLGGLLGLIIDSVNTGNRMHDKVITLPLAFVPGEEPEGYLEEQEEEPEEKKTPRNLIYD